MNMIIIYHPSKHAPSNSASHKTMGYVCLCVGGGGGGGGEEAGGFPLEKRDFQ